MENHEDEKEKKKAAPVSKKHKKQNEMNDLKREVSMVSDADDDVI
jgi:hypothetical protein